MMRQTSSWSHVFFGRFPDVHWFIVRRWHTLQPRLSLSTDTLGLDEICLAVTGTRALQEDHGGPERKEKRFPEIPTTMKTMGVHITTIAYLRVFIIEIGLSIILMVVEAQGVHFSVEMFFLVLELDSFRRLRWTNWLAKVCMLYYIICNHVNYISNFMYGLKHVRIHCWWFICRARELIPWGG